jgi:HSP20 family protein
MQQGPQLSPFQIQQPGMGNQQPWMGPQTSPMQTQAGSPLSSVGPMGQMSQVSPLSQTGGQRRQPQGRRVQQPPVDILDEGDDIVLEIELPGTRKEDIHVTAQRNVIDLRAATPERREKENLIQSERSQTVYRRQIPLGVEIDSEEIDANFEEGVLRLRAPKRDPKSGPQRIEVN